VATRTFWGESSLYGDFVGLDDLMTENPRVVQGFIDIYGEWIDRYGVDGFRIDTARHVNPEFWQSFAPAMLNRARAHGIPNFHIFGEVAAETVDVAQLARHTRVDKLPSVLDFGFARAVERLLAGKDGTEILARMYQDDGLYEGGAVGAMRLPTFTSNHDIGRLAWMIRTARPDATDDEVLKRVMLSNAMLFLLRGVPVVYSVTSRASWARHRPGGAAGPVREPRRQLQRPGVVRHLDHHGRGELQSPASVVRADRGTFEIAAVAPRAATRPPGGARVREDAGVVRGVAHRWRRSRDGARVQHVDGDRSGANRGRVRFEGVQDGTRRVRRQSHRAGQLPRRGATAELRGVRRSGSVRTSLPAGSTAADRARVGPGRLQRGVGRPR
jgi:glycosidase